MLVGVLPGIGPIAGVSLLLPLTFHLDPTEALIMLAGIYYGAQYGGSITSILLNLPGDASSAMTCLDGYPMTRKGRGGAALFLTTFSSLIGGLFSVLLMAGFAPLLASVALEFGSTEYFSMMILGLLAAAALASTSAVKGLTMVVVGLLIGLIGADPETGVPRYTFGRLELFEGINIVIIATGVFGVSEILFDLFTPERRLETHTRISLRSLLPTSEEFRQALAPTARGSIVGAFLGVLPGAGAIMASVLAYAVEKRVSKAPQRFGQGAVEGVASVEAANNSAAQAAFIPTMTLGIPGSSVMALMLGALIVHGITPGPMVISQRPDLFWGLIASFFVGNALLVILNLPLIGIWIRILMIPRAYLFPAVIFFVCIGTYSLSNSTFDVLLVIVFGTIGLVFKLLDYPPAPLILGFILGPMLEEHFRRALLLSNGDPTVFLTQPISGSFLAVSVLLCALASLSSVRKRLSASAAV
jgi:TctA family transporter